MTKEELIKELESLGFRQSSSIYGREKFSPYHGNHGTILFSAKDHLTFIVTINHVVIFNFNDVIFRYSERDGIFEYMLDSHYDEVEQGLDIASMIALYK